MRTRVGEPLYVEIASSADFARYRGTLKGRIVLYQPPRATTAIVRRGLTPSALRALTGDEAGWLPVGCRRPAADREDLDESDNRRQADDAPHA